MVSRSALLVARLLWGVPVLLFLLAGYQAKVARDLRHTLDEGMPARAEVTAYHRVDRKDVTHAEVSLRVRLAGGAVLEKRQLALPYSLAFLVERDTLDVRVLPGADQEVVITEIAATQARIARMNAAMSFVAFLLFGAGVFWWNRYLRRRGDPARRSAA
ncbi:DUF3592 domain-containing protein [Rhodocaloribacter litoris]|uniref:DUF3592 domain-containing protein n=1 Tax=Rhodocaloribacter litoris TaxID=2558931 RepID=UPI00141E502A|nr:DUF3592 domain-containing protein [Rhodocaloribacter litoris]QXD14756.1 DUF3592 domain-containing protein [Rhodocaloribacter litoris]GIV59159.1 MAG: hypothetical protein KatS3mg043_0248 [Rhodothermaceae bacterium]